jgi:hypothetical protein
MRQHLAVPALLILTSLAAIAHADPYATRDLRNSVDDVRAHYEALEGISVPERRNFLAALPASLQEDLWIVHLQRFLDEHPALTQEQRSIVYEGIGLMASGLVAARQANTEQVTDERVIYFEGRVRRAFSKELAARAFYHVGGPPPVPNRSPARRGDKGLKVGTQWVCGQLCECSAASDYCQCGWWEPLPCWKTCQAKIPGPRGCVWQQGCGTFYQYWCDGVCCAGTNDCDECSSG